MDESFKIKITIAGRTYPLKIYSEKEEEGMRKAAKRIDDLMAIFEKNYAVSDKQDVLAMCALQFASQLEINTILKEEDLKNAIEKLNKLDVLIEKYL